MAHRKELGVTEHSVLTVVVVVPQCCAFVKNHTRATTDYKLKSTLLRGKHSCWSSENVEYFSNPARMVLSQWGGRKGKVDAAGLSQVP